MVVLEFYCLFSKHLGVLASKIQQFLTVFIIGWSFAQFWRAFRISGGFEPHPSMPLLYTRPWMTCCMHNSVPFCHPHKIRLETGETLLPKSQLFSSVHDRTYIVNSFWDHRFYLQYWYEANTTFKHLQFMPEHAYTLFLKISNKQGTLSPVYNKVYQGDSHPSKSEC